MAATVRGLIVTFDDGPDIEWTPRVLDALAAAGVSAIFFVVGQRVRAAPQLARRIVAEGHAIGNHTFSHRHPWTMSGAQACREVRDGTAAIGDATGNIPALFRPPHGRVRSCMLETAREQGQDPMLWTRSAIDWGIFATTAGIARRLANTSDGDILLMHDGAGRRNTPQRLLPLLPELLNRIERRRADFPGAADLIEE